jgi:hypothetical protein
MDGKRLTLLRVVYTPHMSDAYTLRFPVSCLVGLNLNLYVWPRLEFRYQVPFSLSLKIYLLPLVCLFINNPESLPGQEVQKITSKNSNTRFTITAWILAVVTSRQQNPTQWTRRTQGYLPNLSFSNLSAISRPNLSDTRVRSDRVMFDIGNIFSHETDIFSMLRDNTVSGRNMECSTSKHMPVPVPAGPQSN